MESRALRSIGSKLIIISAILIIVVFTLSKLGLKVGATGSNITGTVRDPSNNSLSNAYVYATVPSGTDPLYGPVATNSSGAYTLNIPTSGTYDIHIDPPGNTGYASYVDSSDTVSSNQTINETLSANSYTLSGTLSDSSSNPISSATVKLFHGSSQYSATTDSSGNYSISAPAGYYYLYVSGSISSVGMGFTLTQSYASSINLTGGNIALNLTIHTATMTITAYNNDGQLDYGGGGSVNARATSGTTSLYPGDPGTSISLVSSNGFSTFSSATGTITTIVGATYAASGLEASSYIPSICKSINGSSLYDCLRLPLTVTGNVSINLPSSSPNRTFSGTLTDGSGNPISGATVTLVKYSDSSTSTTTDSSGDFTINALPKKYYLKVSDTSVDNISSFTLTQSSSSPSIDLTSDSIVQNLQVKTATLTVTAHDSSGNPDYFDAYTVEAQTTSGSTNMYTGDPGETMTVGSTTLFLPIGTITGTTGTIVGASYSAKGLGVSNSNGSICDQDFGPNWNCLTTALSISGNTSVSTPY